VKKNSGRSAEDQAPPVLLRLARTESLPCASRIGRRRSRARATPVKFRVAAVFQRIIARERLPSFIKRSTRIVNVVVTG
jgi:hypothetical protein